jgi:ligand-binding sensor domain-containing protein
MLSVPTELRAQQLQASLSHYSTEDGMPSNTVASLRTDDYGFLWLATWNGISRFDGYHFYNYKTGAASGVRGLHNRVDNMVIDLSQNIWLKMYDGRVFVINRKTDRIEDPLEGISDHDDFHVDYFFQPYVTSTGDVLISYDDIGLYKLRLDRNGLKQDLITTGQLSVNSVVEGYRNDIWAATDKGVHRINMVNMSLERRGYFLNEHITRLATNGYNIFAGTKSGKILQFSYGRDSTLVKDIGREITSLYVDKHGQIWFSDLGDGAYRLDPQTGDVKFYNQRVLAPEFTSRGAEFGEALGVLWIRMNHGGYGYYNRATDEVEYFHNDPSNPWNLSNTVNARLEMNDGVVWESTNRRGLEKLEVMKQTIARTLLVKNPTSSLDNEIRAMLHDKKRNHTLLANKHGQIFVFDGKMNHLSTITHDNNGHPIGRPYGMSQDSKGNYWVSDKDNGLFKITPNGNSYSVENIRHNDKDPYSLSDNAAYQCVEDRQGNIWVATYGGGVNVLRKDKNGRYIALHAKNVMKRYPPNRYRKVRTIAMDKEGKIWAGTTDGILTLQIRNNNIILQPLEMSDDMTKCLMSNDIVCLATDSHGTMWVGTNSGGLSRAVKKDSKGRWEFENFGIEQGLPSEEIYAVTFDNKGNVWFSTEHILCSFDPQKKILTTFSSLDGVDDTMCSEGAAITLSNGNVIFGTLEGYYFVDRNKLVTKKGSLLKLRITDFFLNGIIQTPRMPDQAFDYYVPESKSVKLPDANSTFAFRFAALNYQFQHRIHYQYMLEGYDDEWQNAGKDRMATYSNLSGGTYQFKVKAFLLESPENYDIRTIEVVVPYSFTSFIVYFILLLLVAGLVYYWYRRRHKSSNDEDEPSPSELTETSDVLSEDIELEVDDTPYADVTEVGVFESVRDDSNLK